jgi:uncharacterized protein (DUF2252 family)
MPTLKNHASDASVRAPVPDQRLPILAAARNAKMARSAHAYVRGNTARFYDWLDSVERVALPEGPSVWICGDCHIGNVGPVADVHGDLAIEIRDFDQTVVGNPAHDLVRLGLSLASAARGSDLPGVVTARMIEQLSLGYTDAFAPRKVSRPLLKPLTVAQAMREAKQRTWRHLARERIEGATRKIPLGKRFWPVSEAERESVQRLVHGAEVHSLVTRLSHRDNAAEVRMLDVAYWMKGCSSLGRLRYAVLVDVGRDTAQGRDFCLLDIKEAITAVAPHNRDESLMPLNNAKRVVAGAKAMSPFLGSRMHADRVLRRSVFVRELLPQDLKLEFSQLTVDEAMTAAYYLARVVGASHARQMDEATRKAWRKELVSSHSKVIDAPPWLWTSVVELVASHEKGYLDHCRRYALATSTAAPR